MTEFSNKTFDTVIVGGGAAGLAAAMVLVRANRQVALIDSREQSNKDSLTAHGVFSRDGIIPRELYETARQQLLTYPSVENILEEALTVYPEFAAMVTEEMTAFQTEMMRLHEAK
jgi:thioredoxin reductase